MAPKFLSTTFACSATAAAGLTLRYEDDSFTIIDVRITCINQIPMTENMIATEGACGMDDCQPFWISYQVMSVIASALLGSTLIGKLIITLRAVLPQDKCTAIAFELLFIGIIVYIPGKLAYRYIASPLLAKLLLETKLKLFRCRQNLPIRGARQIPLLLTRVPSLRFALKFAFTKYFLSEASFCRRLAECLVSCADLNWNCLRSSAPFHRQRP